MAYRFTLLSLLALQTACMTVVAENPEASQLATANDCGPVCEMGFEQSAEARIELVQGEVTTHEVKAGAMHTVGFSHALRGGGSAAIQLQGDGMCWISQESMLNPMTGETHYLAVTHALGGSSAGGCDIVFAGHNGENADWKSTLKIVFR